MTIRVIRAGEHIQRIPGFGMSVRESGVAVAAAALTNFFTASYTGSRNDFSGNVGFWFTPTENITVTALGRSISTAIAQNHRVRIYARADWSTVADVTITSTSPADALGYAYETLSSPVTLTSGTAYAISSNEYSGGDLWQSLGAVDNHAANATIEGGCYGIGEAIPDFMSGVGQAYVPPTFFYT